MVLAFFARRADLTPYSVLGHGLGNRSAKLRHGNVVFPSSFPFRPADAPLSPEPGGRLG